MGGTTLVRGVAAAAAAAVLLLLLTGRCSDTCTRKVETKSSPGAYMYCVFDCFEPVTMKVIQCSVNMPEGTGEFYDMKSDPWQMKNIAKQKVTPALRKHVEAMRHCAGQGAAGAAGGCLLPPLDR